VSETVLVVDDEDGVRRTFAEWLATLPNVRVLAAADAEAALRLANDEPIDLAVLDWNLGSGSDGLRLLEDLVDFRPELVAILVTGYAHQATPLHAMRMGVRDYLDKNHDLTREVFLSAVTKQLDRIVPAKRQRELNRSLAEFREAVQQILPLVRGSSALNEGRLPAGTLGSLVAIAMQIHGADRGALVIRQQHGSAAEHVGAIDPNGSELPVCVEPFRNTFAANVVDRTEAIWVGELGDDVSWHGFERPAKSILAIPLAGIPGVQAVLELFDVERPPADRKAATAAMRDLGSELIRHAFAERQSHTLLAEAVEAALHAGDRVRDTLSPSASIEVLDTLKRGLAADPSAIVEVETELELLEAVRELALRHGKDAVDHCLGVVRSLCELLDRNAG